jgi:hypothetical protein
LDYPDIDMEVDCAAITIGGTIHLTGIPLSPNISIYYGDSVYDNQKESSVSLENVSSGTADGTWSMKVPANLAGQDVAFSLYVNGEGAYFSRSLGTKTIPPAGGTISFDPINISPVTWSGTIDLRVNGVFPSGDASIYATDVSDPYYRRHLGSAQVNPDGTWSIPLSTIYSGSKQVIFGLSIGSRGIELREESMPGATRTDINFGQHRYITLSGSAASTVNGIPIILGPDSDYDISVNAFSKGPFSGSILSYAFVDDSGQWTMLVESFSPAQPLYFTLGLSQRTAAGYINVSKRTGISRTVSDVPMSNINLNSNFNIVTLSGHIDFQINGLTPPDMWLQVHSEPDKSSSNFLGGCAIDPEGNWTLAMDMDVANLPITVYFWVGVQDDDEYETGQSLEVYSDEVSNIELGEVHKNFITLSGTVSGTIDGSPPDACMVAAYIADEDKVLGNASVGEEGEWSIELEALDSPKTVSFIVAPIVGNNVIVKRLPSSYNRMVHTASVPGINLTGPELAITTKTITVNITSNGTTPAPGVVCIGDSPVDASDMEDGGEDAMWSKVISMPTIMMDIKDNLDKFSPTWSLKVPSDTSDVYFFTMTELGVHTATSPVSSDTTPVTLNLSTMTPLPSPLEN